MRCVHLENSYDLVIDGRIVRAYRTEVRENWKVVTGLRGVVGSIGRVNGQYNPSDFTQDLRPGYYIMVIGNGNPTINPNKITAVEEDFKPDDGLAKLLKNETN